RSRVSAGATSAPRNGRQKARKVKPIVSGIIPSPSCAGFARRAVFFSDRRFYVAGRKTATLERQTCDVLPIFTRIGRAYGKVREIGTVSRGIARDQGQAGDRGMGADEEIRKHARPAAAGPAVGLEGLSGKKKRLPRDGQMVQLRKRDHRIEIGNIPVAYRKLGIDDIVDPERTEQRGGFQLRLRPCGPD